MVRWYRTPSQSPLAEPTAAAGTATDRIEDQTDKAEILNQLFKLISLLHTSDPQGDHTQQFRNPNQ